MQTEKEEESWHEMHIGSFLSLEEAEEEAAVVGEQKRVVFVLVVLGSLMDYWTMMHLVSVWVSVKKERKIKKRKANEKKRGKAKRQRKRLEKHKK